MEQLAPEQLQQPLLWEEVSFMLGAASLRFYNPEGVDPNEYGFEQFVYGSCVRAIAALRAQERAEVSDSPGYVASQFNESFELTTKRLATLALEPRLAFLARQLSVVHEAEASFNERWEELKEELYADQQPYAFDLIASLQKAPKLVSYIDRQGALKEKEVLGVTAVAPTGAGKSHLMEMCVTVIADSGVERSIVIVVPSLQLQGQLIEKFRNDLPHLRTGGISSEANDSPKDHDVMIITIDAFNTNFRHNTLSGHPVDLLMIDEVHHLTEPEFSQTWLEHWDGQTMGFTATPAYGLHKDARHLLPRIVEHTDILELIDMERLNDGQIFTLPVDDEIFAALVEDYGVDPATAQSPEMVRFVIDSLVIDFIKPLIQEGRRGIIFCEPGDTAKNARELAARLSATKLDSGRLIKAEAMYSAAKNHHAVMKDYYDGVLDVITTVDTGREGLNASFDFVVVNCSIRSRLRGVQIVGRGTRPGEQFKVTIYAQFMNNLLQYTPQNYHPFLLEEAFGELPSEFHQGRTLRGCRARRAKEGGWQRSKEEGKAALDCTPPDAADITLFSERIQSALAKVDRRPIGESLYAAKLNAWMVEEGMEPLHTALLGHDIREIRAMEILRRAGFTWRGKYEEVDGKRKLIHYYTTEAIAYLKSKLPTGRVFNRVEAAARLGVTLELFDHLVSTPLNHIEGREVARPGKWTTVCYDEAAMALAEIAKQKVPGMQPDDRPALDIAKELGVDSRVLLRLLGLRGSKRYRLNGVFNLTAAEIAEAKKICLESPEAEPTDKYLTAIAEMLGVNPRFVNSQMTPSEVAQGTPKRYNDKRGYLQFGTVWSEKHWEPMVGRLKKLIRRPLAGHLIHLTKETLGAMVRFGSKADIKELTKELIASGYNVEEVAILDNKFISTCVSWPAIAALQQQRGEPRYTRRTPKIDFARLPTGPDDLDPDKIAYAQTIQRRFLRDEQLKNYNEAPKQTSQD